MDAAGATLLRVTPEAQSQFHWALQALKSCPSFYTYPGLLSFYFWGTHSDPIRINNGSPTTLLSPAQQEQVVTELDRQPGLCILRDRDLQAFFIRRQSVTPTQRPLLSYIEKEFEVVASRGPYELLRRKH